MSTYSRLPRHSVELQRLLTMFSVSPIPERNIICPLPRDPAKLILIWDKGWCTSLIGKRKGKQNAKCEWFRRLLLNVYHVWTGPFSWDKWTKMRLKLQTEKRLQNGCETQFSNGSISVPLCHIVLFNIVQQIFPQHLIVLKVGIILVEITRRNSRVWATD